MERGNILREEENGKLDLIASRSFNANQELVRVVDFLNKNLKAKKIMFGISKDLGKEKDKMTINIYEF